MGERIMDTVYDEIHAYIQDLEIIDTHEHLPPRENLREKETDFLKEYLTHYFNSDLISCGLRPENFEKAINHELPLMDRWRLVEPYWDIARITGYGKALDITVKGIYGIDSISEDTVEELNQAFIRSLKPGHFAKVLKEKSKIKISLLDEGLDCDKSFFRSVYRMDRFISPQTFDDIIQMERDFDASIVSFNDWLDACETALDNSIRLGAVALKSGLAYQRSLSYPRTTYHEAEGMFNLVLKQRRLPVWMEHRSISFPENLQNYMMHHVLNLADKRSITYQFHTGIQEGNGNFISESDPSLLSNLFLEYPRVNFDVFHIGYPYQQTLSVLAKNFANVFIDMCWAHIVSPSASRSALTEWLDAVPYNKISAFGGDYAFVDAVYGHQYMARENVSRSLTQKVKEGSFDISRAKEISHMLFIDNPMKIFNLEGKL